MPFKSVADPEDLAKLTQAFDIAWSIIQERQPIEPLSVPAERERLGHIIVTLWRTSPECDLVARGLEQFQAGALLKPLRLDAIN